MKESLGMRLVSRFVTLALGSLALAACTDQAADAAAKAAAERKKEVSAAIAGIEQQAKDGTNYAFVVREVGKRRAQAWGDAELLKRLDDCVEKARKSRDDLLQTYFGKAEAVAKAALAVSEPEASAQACRDAIDVLDGTKTLDGQQKIPAAVVLKF